MQSTIRSREQKLVRVQLRQNNACVLLLRILSILHPDSRSVRGVYEYIVVDVCFFYSEMIHVRDRLYWSKLISVETSVNKVLPVFQLSDSCHFLNVSIQFNSIQFILFPSQYIVEHHTTSYYIIWIWKIKKGMRCGCLQKR